MYNVYGLGIILRLDDQASKGIQGVDKSMQNLSMTAMSLTYMGKNLMGMGKSMLSPLIKLGSSIATVGDDMERTKITLGALYEDAALGAEKLNGIIEYAAKTPFEIEGLKESVLQFKTLGVEILGAGSHVTSSSGKTREFIETLGDIGAGLSGIAKNGFKDVNYAVREFVTEGNKLSFLRRLGVDIDAVLTKAGKSVADTVEGRMKNMADLVEILKFEGLTEKMFGTWSQVMSNMDDIWVMFVKKIGDAGAFDAFKGTLTRVGAFLSDTVFNSAKFDLFAKSISDAFVFIMKPIDWLGQKLMGLVDYFVNLTAAHPWIMKLAMGIMAFTGVLFLAAGAALLLKGAMLVFTYGIGMALSVLSGLLVFIGLFAIIRNAWNKDLMGIRSGFKATFGFLGESFRNARAIMKLESDEMGNAYSELIQKLNGQDQRHSMDWLTLKFLEIGMTWRAMVELIKNSEISDETFKVLEKMGLVPVVERLEIWRQKFIAFCDGVSTGFAKVIRTIQVGFSRFIANITESFPILGTLYMKLKDKNLNFDSWKNAGEIVGKFFAILLGGIGIFKMFTGVKGLITAGITAPLTKMGTKVGTSFGNIVTKFTPFTKGIWGAGKAVGGFAGNAISIFTKLPVIVGGFFKGIPFATFFMQTSILTGVLKVKFLQFFRSIPSMLANLPSIIGGFFKNLPSMIGGFIKNIPMMLKNTFMGLGKGLLGIFKSITTGLLTSPIFWIILAVVAAVLTVIAVIRILKNRMDEVKQAVQPLKDALTGYDWGGLFKGFTDIVNNVKQVFIDMWNNPVMQKAMKTLEDTIIKTIGVVSNVLATIIPKIMDLVKAIMPIIGMIVGYVAQAIAVFMPVAAAIVTKIMEIVNRVLPPLCKIITIIIDMIIQAMPVIKAVIEAIMVVVMIVIDYIAKVVFPIIMGIVDAVVNVAMSIVNTVLGLVESIQMMFTGFMEVIKGIFGLIVGLITGDWDKVGESTKRIWEGIKTFFGGWIQGVKTVFLGIVDVCVAPFKSAIETIKEVWNGLVDFVSGVAEKIGNFFKKITGGAKDAKESAKDVGVGVPQAARGIRNFIGGLIQVNEQGGEIIDLPRGSTVIPHDKSVQRALVDGIEFGMSSMRSLFTTGLDVVPVGGDVGSTPSNAILPSDNRPIEIYENRGVNIPTVDTPPNVAKIERETVSEDNRVIFEKGSIVIQIEKASDSEAEKFADKILAIIEKKKKRKKLATYAY